MRWWTPMACRSISHSRRVRRTTIGCVRFSSTPCFHKRCYSRIRRGLDQGACPPARRVGQYSAETQSQRPDLLQPVLYRARNLIERFFNKIKQCRRIPTRYDKLAANYLAFIKLASIRLWLRTYESTP